MGQVASEALTNGRSLHARSRTVVSCLYTLQFCIAMLHATAAPLQYRPLSGTNRTDGVRAVSVLTETITELALDAPQISNAETYSLTTLIHIEKESYLNETRAGLDLPLWSSKHAAMIPLTDLRTLHAEDASILRSTRSPNLCVDVANFMFKFSAGDHQESFHTPLYKEATISAEQQEQHFSEYEPLLEVRARAMAAGKAPSYRGPLHEEIETVLAAAAGRQHRTITGNPTNASLADPQPPLELQVPRLLPRKPKPDLLSDLRVMARVLLPWTPHKVCNLFSYRCLLGMDLSQTAVSASITPLSIALDIERTRKLLLPNSVASNQWPVSTQLQHDWLYVHMSRPQSAKVTQQVRRALNDMLNYGTQGIQATYVQGKGHTDPIHATVYQGVWEQLPLAFVLGLVVLDALSVTTWLLGLTVTYTMAYAKKALLCVLAVKKKLSMSNATARIKMFNKANLIDRLWYYVASALSTSIPIMQRLRLHFAIHFCITQRILSLKNHPLDCCIEYDAQQCRFASHMWMSIVCTGLSLLTCTIDMLVRRLANLVQSANTTPWHAYCSTIRHLFDHPKFANRRYRARMTYNHRRSHQQMKAHIRLDRLHGRLSSTVNILKRLYRLDKWLTLEKTANAVLGETHSLIWDWLYDKDSGAATDSNAAKPEHSQKQVPTAGDKDSHTPPEASSHNTESRGGRRVQAKLGHQLQCQQVNSETGLYMEIQLRKFCQLHALNALFGRNIVQPQTMLDFCAEETRTNTSLGRTLKNGGYSPHDGNFPDMAINAWLHHNCQPKARLKCIEESIPRNSNEAAFTGCLPPHMDAFVLRWNQGRLAHEDTGYGHAVCIRRHPVTKDWYLLDSDNQRAKRMTPSLWTELKGSVFVLAEGSAYNHNIIVGARDEGYTQAAEASVLLMPDQVTLTHISGGRIRAMTRKRRQGDTVTDPMLVNSIEPQRPSKQSTQTTLESTLRKQPAKPPADRRREQANHGPATVKPTHSVRKRINNISKASAEQHQCSDIRSFWCKKLKEEQPTAATTSTADGKEQHAKKAKTDGGTTLELPSLKTLCWNVMGLTTVQDELVRIVDEHKPDVIVLAETKMRRQGKTRQRLAAALPEYQLYTSCKPDPENPRPGERWAAGVAMAVHKSLTRHASAAHQLLNKPAASGHCQWVTLQPAGSDALNLWAVYMPHDMELRKQVYQVLRDNVSINNATLMAGDWNAAYIAADRASGRLNTADTAHQQLLADLQLCPTDDDTHNVSREHTFFSKADAGQHSRIDDQVISMNLKTGRKPTTVVLKNITDDSDHYPILSDIPLDAINFQRPGPELPAPDRTATLKLPLTKRQLNNYKLGTELKIGMAARQLAAELEEVIQQADAAVEDVAEADQLGCSNKDRLKMRGLSEEQVLHYASMMADMMSKAVEVAHETCEYTKGGPVPKRRYLKREHAKACNCLDGYRACLTHVSNVSAPT